MVAAVFLAACAGMPDPSGSGGGTGAGTTSGGGLGTGGGSATGGGSSTGGGAGGGVVAHRDELTGGTRLKVRALVASDGARVQQHFFDTMRMEPCAFALASDGSQRCLPYVEPYANFSSQYSDAQCTSKLFMSATCAGAGAVKYGLEFVPLACANGFSLHGVSPVTPSTAYALSGTTCVASQVQPTWKYFASTGVIPPTSFVAATYVVEP